MTERTIDVYGVGLRSVQQQAATLIAEQEREGWAFTRITVAKAGKAERLYTHIATVTFMEASDA